MRTPLLLSLTSMALLLLTACSDSEPSTEPESSSVPVSFTALTQWTTPPTRLTTDDNSNSVTFTQGDAFGVFAYHNNSSTPNLMNNQKVAYDGSSWIYSPLKYWSNDEHDKLNFFAYYPWTNGGAIQARPQQDGTLQIDYNCPEADIDLMVSDQAKDRRYTPSGNSLVAFTFHHLLARVRFTFTYIGTDAYHPVIHLLEYPVQHVKGIATCYDGGDDSDLFRWSVSDDEEVTTVSRLVTDVAGTVLNSNNQLVPEFTAYLMPYAFPYSATETDHIGQFVISLNNKLYYFKPKSQIPLLPGKSYTVNFQITNDYGSTGTYFITSYSIWKDGGTIDGTLE